MTGIELLDVVDRVEREQGLSFVTLVVSGRSRLTFRKRVLPGKPSLFGQVVGTDRDRDDKPVSIVSVKCSDVRRWVLGNLHKIEAMAIENMERGHTELAARQLEEYSRLRDRLSPCAGDDRGGRV